MAKKLTNFNKKDIQNLPLPAPGKKAYYYDQRCKDLELIVTSTGAKTFYVYRWYIDPVTRKGKPERIKLGRFAPSAMQSVEFETNPLCVLGNNASLNPDQARRLAEAVLGQLATSRNPKSEQQWLNAEPTVSELFEQYMDRHIQKQRKTGGKIRECFNRWFDLGWQERKATSVGQADIERLHARLGEQRGTYAANRALQLISAVYNKAILWKLYTGDNPARGVTKFTESARERVLREDELEAFFVALDQCELDFQDFVRLCLFTGQRMSNVLSIRHTDVDTVAGTWKISAEDMKNRQSLCISLSDIELDIFKRRANNGSSFVFPGEGRTSHYVEPKRAWSTLCRRAGIKNLHVHDLRRSLASYMANTGANVALIQGALNHKDIKTTLNVYARTAKQSERAAREKAVDLMRQLGKQKESNLIALKTEISKSS